MLSDLDRSAVRRGAAGVLMFVAPAYIIAKVAAANDGDSTWWMLLVIALLFGSMFGGYAGARDRPPLPIMHGAVSAGGGLFIVLSAALVVQLLTGDLSLTITLTAIVILQIGIGLGCLGGLLAAKGYRPK